MRLEICETKDRLSKGGAPFFLLADTVWGIFSSAALHEWEEYLFLRKQQQFNALQIHILPLIGDASDTHTGLYPFHRDPDGKWDFHRINDAFFDNAETMVRMAVDSGFLPVLALLWRDYVPGTWANNKNPDLIMPKDAVKPFAEYVANRFKPYEPMYFISGDIIFDNEEVSEYHFIALESIKAVDPDALTAMHVGGGRHELPDRIFRSPCLDLYTYQSGHVWEVQQDSYKLAEQFMKKSIKRPIFNSEPCYDGCGYGNEYGRFDAFDVRKAFWWSVLSGAKAGFAYGAHGLFSWYRKGAVFTSENWCKIPFDWKTALQLPGAWDVSYSKWLFDRYELQGLEPGNDHLLTPYEDIRMAISPNLDKFALYIPYSNDAVVNLDLSGYQVEIIALANRQVIRPEISVQDGVSVIRMLEMNSDSLVIGRREKK